MSGEQGYGRFVNAFRIIGTSGGRGVAAAMAGFFILVASAQADVNPRRTPIQPGPNGPILAISAPDSNGVRYLGGVFTAFNAAATGGGALVDSTKGTVNRAFPPVTGTVEASAPDGSGGFYIGGSFTAVDGTTRNNVAHILADGSLDQSWDPNVNGAVNAIAVSGSTVYLGGSFTTVGGTTRNRAAAVGSDGTLQSWDPNLNDPVYALAVSGSTVYLGGSFTTVGGTTRNRAAAVDTDGTLQSWDPNVGRQQVNALAVSGSTVYLGGSFTTVGGTTRNRAAAVGTDGTLEAWDPNVGGTVNAIAVSGSNVYLGGGFTTVGGTTRNRAAAVGTDGTLQSWDPNVSGTVYEIAVSGLTVYMGGSFRTVGGTIRNSAAAVGTDGTLQSWNPNLNSTAGAIAVSGSTVYLGGNFKTVGGTPRNCAAAVGSDGALKPWNPNVNDGVTAIAVSGSNVYLGGSFTAVGGTTRNRAAAVGTDGTLQSWDPNLDSPVATIAVSGSNVYLGGSFAAVGGTTRNRAAAVGTDGTLQSWDPNLNGAVNTIAVSGSNVYLGGSFTAVGGTTRNSAAAVSTGGVLQTWNPNVNGRVIVLAVSGSNVYLGGYFTTVGGTTRNGAAAVSTSGTLQSWNPNLGHSSLGSGLVATIVVSGSNVYLGGTFMTVGGTTRNNAAAVSTGGTLQSWNPNLNDSIGALAVSGSTVYLGGWFTTVGGNARSYSATVGTNGTLGSQWPAVDATAPSAPGSFTGVPSSPTQQTDATIGFTLGESGGTVECRLDSGSWGACTSVSDTTGSYAVSGLSDGSHTVSVRHVDDMDNVSEVATTSAWTVDATAPSAPGSFTGVPSSPTNSTTATIGFTLGEADGTVECRLDAGSWGECSSVSGTTGSHSVSGLADGSHSVSVRQTDALGNVSAVGTSSSWTVDRTPPVAPSVSRVSPSAHLSNETAASIAYSGEAGVSFSCSLDGGPWTACSESPVSLSSVADGLHTFSVKAVDDAGNESQEASVSWDVDTVPHAAPVVDLSSPESSPSNSTSATVAWEGVPGATYLCSLDGASYEVCPNSPALLTDLGEGSHTFRVKARDAVGNLSDAGSVTWVVDVTAPAAPVLSLDSPSRSPSRSTSAAISYSGEAGATFTCSLDAGAWRPCEASPENLDGLADGSHTLRVRATDAAGNISDVSSVTWVVDSVAPAAPVLSGAPSGSTSTTSAWIAFTGEAGASFECSLDAESFSACVSPQGLLSLSVGAHVYSVRAVDSAGNVGQAATVSWTVVAPPSSVKTPAVLTPPAGTKTVYKKGDRWAIKAGALFSTNGDTRNAAKLQTLQVAVDSRGRPASAKPSDSASAPKKASYANGVLAFSNAVDGELLRQSFAQPVWVRASNKAGKWTVWVKLTP